MTDFVILRFRSGDETLCTKCHHYDLERGYVQIKTKEKGSVVNHGLFSFNECQEIIKLTFIRDDEESLKWCDLDKLFKKYPKLKRLCA